MSSQDAPSSAERNASTAPSEGGLAKAYRPSDHEPAITARWAASGAFHPDPERVLRGEAKPYSIVIPPPNVTGALHLGHALNNTLQDILTRVHRMRGYETLWMPGTDHAGIATQAVVEKRLRKEGILKGPLKDAMTRDQFVEQVQKWKDEYEARITMQLRAMGASCDFDRQRFTMDDICARAVREAFFILFRDGLIYRGKRLVNWDTALQTAVADDECYDEEVDTSFWYMRYPLETPVKLPSGETIDHVTVATTRPETYLGDTAVAMNPKDPRAKALEGKKVVLPLVGRVIPMVLDSYVVLPEAMATSEEEKNDPKAKFATGFLKVTPAHDPNDEQIGLRHALPSINMMSPDGKVSDKHGWSDVGDASEFVGLKMADARKAVVEKFKALGLLEDIKPHRHSVKFSDRSKAIIEPYLSDQWFLKVTDDALSGAANRALASSSNCGTGVPPVTSFSHSRVPGKIGLDITRNFSITKRNLPHFQTGGSTYHVTFRASHGELSPSERAIVLNACFHFHQQRHFTHVVTVMPDHVHMIFTPLEREQCSGHWWSLQELLHSIKSFSSHEINKARGTTGTLWQDEYFDRIIRENERDETWNYVVFNPVKKGLAERPEDYAFTQVFWLRDGHQEVDADHGRDARATEEGELRSSTDATMSFHPARYAKTYEQWHDNIRDWCISRQLWWGHQIPVWTKSYPSFWQFSGGPGTEQDEFSDTLSGLDVGSFEGLSYSLTSPDHPGLSLRGGSTEAMAIIQQNPRVTIHVCVRDAGTHSTYVGDLDIERWLLEHGFERDPDVLDTWFSSALWPLSTMGWPDSAQSPDTKNLLEAFNPTSVLSTAREIITLWVSRMVMMNRYLLPAPGGPALRAGSASAGSESGASEREDPARRAGPPGTGPAPFKDVFIHAVVQDGNGQKMSKSLGNGVDPLDIIESHGADAMRFTLCHMTTQTQDVRMPVVKDSVTGKNTSPKFDFGRNFCNKLWNAARFTLSILEKAGHARNSAAPASPSSPAINPSTLTLVDRWMLSRLATTTRDINANLASYEFSEYAESVYKLLWWDFCDWYLEAIKATVDKSPAQQVVLARSLDTILRLLHPLMPFVTETIWEQFRGVCRGKIEGLTFADAQDSGLLCVAGWPEFAAGASGPALIDSEAEREFESLRELVNAIRNVRSEHQVVPKRRITLHTSPETTRMLALAPGFVETLAGLEGVTANLPEASVPSVTFRVQGQEHVLSNLADAIDAGAETDRLTKQLDQLRKSAAALNGRLSNPGYVDKAPPKLVEESKAQLAKIHAEIGAIESKLGQR